MRRTSPLLPYASLALGLQLVACTAAGTTDDLLVGSTEKNEPASNATTEGPTGSATADAPKSWTLLFYGKADSAHAGALAGDFAGLASSAQVDVVVNEGTSTLADAAKAAFANHPSNHRGVVVWTRDDAAIDLGSVDRLDFFGLDVGGAPSLETAFSVASVADVFIASSSSDGSAAWAYGDVVASAAGSINGAAFATAENAAFAARVPHGARLHVAVNSSGLAVLGRATASLVESVALDPEAIVDVGAAGGGARTPFFADFATALGRRPNRGVVTTAALNAAEHLVGAAIAGPADVRDFVVALPPPGSVSSDWFASYGASFEAWSDATKWNGLVASFAHFGAGRSDGPSFTASLVSDSAEVLPEFGGGPAYVRVLSHDVAHVSVDLVKTAMGAAPISYGEVGSAGDGGIGSYAVAFDRQIGTVSGQDAMRASWRASKVLLGRIACAGEKIPAAVVADNGAAFVLHPEESGEAVRAERLLARDPNATFAPALGQGGNVVYGSPVPLRAVLPGFRAVGPGVYELRVTAATVWGGKTTVTTELRIVGGD